MTYEQYKQTISRAKWALTFGEGLDGYFIEPVFSGSISFSVYNASYFTVDFKDMPTVYESYDAMSQRICRDITSLDSEPAYTNYNSRLFDLCHRYYNYGDYVRNLEAFYRKDYTFK